MEALEQKIATMDPGKERNEQEDALENLYRETIRLSSEETRMLKEEPADLIRNVEILRALRTASTSNTTSEISQSNLASSKSRKARAAKPESSAGMDSPGPAPSVVIPAARLKGNPVRSGSVAPKDVKIEEGSEGSKGPSAERAGKFVVGAEVAYKQAKPKEDGSQWIQCIIINVTEVGNKKRYEVQDPEPDENGAPGDIYKASAAALIAISPPDAELADYPVGKHVLARYPETTTFYRAEVTGAKKNMCRLKFEDDQNQEMEVDRRFVLDFASK